MKKIFLFVLMSVPAAALQAQSLAWYTLVKTAPQNLADGTSQYQWVASNRSSAAGDFFIQERIAAQAAIRSIAGPGVETTPPLPLAGPASLLVGPFPIPAGSSVTFTVSEDRAGAADGSFRLLTQSQLSQVHAASVTLGNPTAGPGAGSGLVGSVVAAPNVSENGAPIRFQVQLSAPAGIKLILYALTGEKVADLEARGIAGANQLEWGLENNAHRSVASGLYLYCLKVTGPGGPVMRFGKLLVIR